MQRWTREQTTIITLKRLSSHCATGFSIAGWGGYHGRYNGAYVPTGESRDGRPIFKHTGPGMEWCRTYWAHGFWKIGHEARRGR